MVDFEDVDIKIHSSLCKEVEVACNYNVEEIVIVAVDKADNFGVLSKVFVHLEGNVNAFSDSDFDSFEDNNYVNGIKGGKKIIISNTFAK